MTPPLESITRFGIANPLSRKVKCTQIQYGSSHPHGCYLTHGVASGNVANGTLHLSALAAIASVLFELTQSTPTSPLMLSHMTTALVAVPLPHGDVTVKFLKVMFSQIAFGLELHVKEATARPYFPDV